MKRESWIDICESFRELFELLGNEDYDFTTSKRFTSNEIDKVNQVIKAQKNFNGWFTEESVKQALRGLSEMLNPIDLSNWLSLYSYNSNHKKVLLIMAGNLPLVGFHDLLCVWLSGNFAQIKLSSDDATLLPEILDLIAEIHPEIKNYYTIEKGKITQSEAIIATGGDNSNLYFEKYFGHLPSLFRKNRTSIAILEGDETKEELHNLGKDIFQFYGKGCRTVSYLLIPESYNLDVFFDGILHYHEIIHHKKYGNNYDYNRAINLLNRESFLDNNFVLLKESTNLFSPISIVHYSRYQDENQINAFIQNNLNQIQIVIGKNYIPFGEGQKPKLWDYADGVDTMSWLNQLT